MSKIVIHAVGGAGQNIATKVSAAYQASTEVKVLRIDSSKANYDGDDLFLLTHRDESKIIDGGGGVIGTHLDEGQAFLSKYIAVNKLLTEDSDVHVIIHSSSGGTGSTLGSSLAEYLRKLNKAVLVCMITDDFDTIRIENTLKVFKRYRGISIKHPMSILFAENKGKHEDERRNDADALIVDTVNLLGVLLEKETLELDSRDVINTFKPEVFFGGNTEGLGVIEITTSNSVVFKEEKGQPLIVRGASETSGSYIGPAPRALRIGITDKYKKPMFMIAFQGGGEAIDKYWGNKYKKHAIVADSFSYDENDPFAL
jgi:cell division GTPase FtsZ